VPKLLVAALSVAAALSAGLAHGALPGGNLVVNAGAEDGTTSSWNTRGTFTVEPYDTMTGARGANFFSGGTESPSSAEQTIDLSSARKAIDAGRIDVRVSALIGGPGTVAVRTEDGAGRLLSQRNLKAVGDQPARASSLVPIPPEARSVTVTMRALGEHALFDNVLVTVSRRRTPRPQRGESVLVTPAKGVTVLLRRGNRKPITRPTLVPLGSVLDTSRGTATVVAADDRYGAVTDRGSFSQGVFAVDQRGGETRISLGGRRDRSCTRPRRLVSRAQAGFKLLAGASASRAVSSRAVWVAEDQCTATTIDAHRGSVDVLALRSRKATSGHRVRRLSGNGRGGSGGGGRGGGGGGGGADGGGGAPAPAPFTGPRSSATIRG
jgi:uncharacterized membrane protein YgcG